MKIGVISDTHARHCSQLPQNLLKALEKVDLIVHAGDIVTMDVIRGLETVAPLKGVCGNMDLPEVRMAFPEKLVLELEGRKIAVMHGSGGPAGLENLVTQAFPEVDIIIFGHSPCRRLPRRGRGDDNSTFQPPFKPSAGADWLIEFILNKVYCMRA